MDSFGNSHMVYDSSHKSNIVVIKVTTKSYARILFTLPFSILRKYRDIKRIDTIIIAAISKYNIFITFLHSFELF